MKKLIIYYNFIIVTAMVFVSFTSAGSYAQLASAALFYPLFVYFGLLIIPRRQKAIVIPEVEVAKLAKVKKVSKKKGMEKVEEEEVLVAEKVNLKEKFDIDRRSFLKLIGSAGMTLFLFSIFTKKAQAAFFGSNPGPGIVGVKDSTGTLIDPAIKHPTDGYKIAELDDSTPAYYGFVNKDGDWFIMKEDTGAESVSYVYFRGVSPGFSANWGNRINLQYEYFDEIF